MILFIFFLAACILAVITFLQLPKFGKIRTDGPERRSPNWSDNQFQNQHHTPPLAENVSMYTVMKKFFFGKSDRVKPDIIIPSIKTDLLSLDPGRNVLVWFGHSSYFMQVDGKTILVDPVFSGAASPIKATTRSFPGADIYTPQDMPPIDYLFISHDHWDHLDYETVMQLQPKVKQVITGLGTGAHFERWGYDMSIVSEKDWNEELVLADGFTVHITPSRHFSGRGLKRNRAIWVSFVLQTPSHTIYLGGDSGYDTHFKEIGDQYGPFDLVILECGQYNEYWKYIHMLPHQIPQAAVDLRAKKLLPVHWAKFALSIHAWDEPILQLMQLNKHTPILTPMIGEPVELDEDQVFSHWWLTDEPNIKLSK